MSLSKREFNPLMRSEVAMTDDLFPNEPRREVPAEASSLETSVLRYAATRNKGITLHGILRDLPISHKQAANLLTDLAGKRLILPTGSKRNGCNIYVLTDASRELLAQQ